MSNEPKSEISGHIQVVDLFAGPGGLGEGFSSVEGDPFRIIVSAEMNSAARKTLRLRAFYRLLKRRGGSALDSYYRFCNGESDEPHDEGNLDLWEKADEEARLIELGTPAGDDELDQRISDHDVGPDTPWVLIGGPPCQAYSVVGRVRNRGNVKYKPENDHRHFLYKEYLRIIQKYRPGVFVMENVKGILSASVGGKRIFESILMDLSDPDKAVGESSGRAGYRIHSMSCSTIFSRGDDPATIDAHDFVIKADDHGIPQARHRVILIGVREDIPHAPGKLERVAAPGVREVIEGLPRLRSGLTKEADSSERWADVVRGHFARMAREVARTPKHRLLHEALVEAVAGVKAGMPTGNLQFPKRESDADSSKVLGGWYHDARLRVWLNHDARAHMSSDLQRYAFASAYARAYHRSPKGHVEFDLDGLRPNHENWESGKFKDRFRVQCEERPSTTITSHISKDGHYFIHYDPCQCRSLTVREAARLQTFPDNYYFQGNRTEQFHQVGNAVPPLLAKKIAKLVLTLLTSDGADSPGSVGSATRRPAQAPLDFQEVEPQTETL